MSVDNSATQIAEGLEELFPSPSCEHAPDKLPHAHLLDDIASGRPFAPLLQAPRTPLRKVRTRQPPDHVEDAVQTGPPVKKRLKRFAPEATFVSAGVVAHPEAAAEARAEQPAKAPVLHQRDTTSQKVVAEAPEEEAAQVPPRRCRSTGVCAAVSTEGPQAPRCCIQGTEGINPRCVHGRKGWARCRSQFWYGCRALCVQPLACRLI